MNKRLVTALLLAGLLPGLAFPAMAADVVRYTKRLSPADKHTPLLTINGPQGRQTLTLATLERLPHYQSTLKTGWGSAGTYQGVLLTDLLKAYGLEGSKALVLRAQDNYASLIPSSRWQASRALVATRLNGKPIPAAEKGPLVVLWPEQEQEALAGGEALSGWVWFLIEIAPTP